MGQRYYAISFDGYRYGSSILGSYDEALKKMTGAPTTAQDSKTVTTRLWTGSARFEDTVPDRLLNRDF